MVLDAILLVELYGYSDLLYQQIQRACTHLYYFSDRRKLCGAQQDMVIVSTFSGIKFIGDIEHSKTNPKGIFYHSVGSAKSVIENPSFSC